MANKTDRDETTGIVVSDAKSTALMTLDNWGNFETVKLNNRLLEQNLVISATRKDPAHKEFDILRTRMLQY